MVTRSHRHSHLRGEYVACKALLLVAFCTAGCAWPWSGATPRPNATRTPTQTPLARTLIYWNADAWLLALQPSDGQARWRIGNWTLPGPYGSTNYFAPGDPVAADGTLFAAADAYYTGVSTPHGFQPSETPTAYAINPADGSIRWQTALAGCFPEPEAKPLVAAGVVYIALSGHSSGAHPCGPSGWVYALSEADGAVLWRRAFADVVFPTLALTDGVLVVLNDTYPALPDTLSLTGLRPSDGAQLWQVQRASGGTFAAADGVVVLSHSLWAGHGDQWTMYVEAFRAGDGTSLWHAELAVHFSGEVMSMTNGLVYVGSDLGYLYALRTTDGGVAWRFKTGVTSMGEPLLADGDLSFGAGSQLVVLNATTGALVRTYAPSSSSTGSPDGDTYTYRWGQPLVTGGLIFITGATDSTRFPMAILSQVLYALDQASGRVLWQRASSLPAVIVTSPVALTLLAIG